MPLLDDLGMSVAGTNLKVVADSPAFYAGLAMSNATSHQQRLQTLSEAALASAIKNLTEMDTSQAVAELKATSGNEVAGTISALLAALQSGQVGTKVAQTTPPVTP